MRFFFQSLNSLGFSFETHVLCLIAHVWLCNSMVCSPPGSLVHGDSPGKNTGVRCHVLLHWNTKAVHNVSCIRKQNNTSLFMSPFYFLHFSLSLFVGSSPPPTRNNVDFFLCHFPFLLYLSISPSFISLCLHFFCYPLFSFLLLWFSMYFPPFIYLSFYVFYCKMNIFSSNFWQCIII